MGSGSLLYRWPRPLVEGRLISRYERFIANVRLGRTTVKAHCVNPGRMEGMLAPNARVWLSPAESPTRALRWTWELVELDGVLVGANTALPNTLVHEVLKRGLIDSLDSADARIVPEQAFGRGHRVDFVLERAEGQRTYVEVKNCHLVYPDGCGYFPDSKSERATHHVDALARLACRGVEAHVVFTLQRHDVQAVRPSALHDPAFASAVRRAARQGVGFHAVRLVPSLDGIRFDGLLPVLLEPYSIDLIRDFARALEPSSGWLRKDGGFSGQRLARPQRPRALQPHS